MEILELILHKYSRLFLNNITTLIYTPKSNVQLILGSNGSGKSSLMEMLNPLPADIKNKFGIGGYKKITIRKDRRTYVLTSGVEGPTKHSFRIDGMEHNLHGTKTVQLQLVNEYFNVTPKKYEIILGSMVLSKMGTNDRKHWLREMSSLDYGFSIELYNKLKSRLRDVNGGIKILKNELIKDASLKLSNEDIELYSTKKVETKELIEEFMYAFKSDVAKVIDVKSELSSVTNKLERLYNPEIHTKSEHSYGEQLTSNQIELVKLDKDIDVISEKLSKIEYIENNSQDIEAIEANIKYISDISDKLKMKCDKYGIRYGEALETVQDYNMNYAHIIECIGDLLPYDHVIVKRLSHQALVENVDTVTSELNKLNDKLRINQIKRDGIKSALTKDNKITCNNCGTESYFGYDEKLLSDIEDTMVSLEKKIARIKPAYERDTKELNLVVSKIKHIKELRNIFSENIRLIPLWEKLVSDKSIGEINSVDISMFFNTVKSELEDVDRLPKFLQVLEEEQKKLSTGKEILEVRKTMKSLSKNEYSTQLEIKYSRRKVLVKDIEFGKRTITELEQIKTLTDHLGKLLKQNKKNRNIEIVNARNSYIKSVVSTLKLSLLDCEDKLNENAKVANRLKSNEALLADYQKREKVLQETIRTLSPTEGLMAKSINGFINKILQEMNTIINNVWSYNITLLPCEITEDNDLDYKFKVKVDGRKDIKDVSELSTSMKDIVDLAFKLIFMKYTKLSNMPLYLDEFGVTMDDAHRHNVYTVIDTILCNAHTHVFICAHFKSMYGRFLKADVNILDSKNLDINSDLVYNTVLNIA